MGVNLKMQIAYVRLVKIIFGKNNLLGCLGKKMIKTNSSFCVMRSGFSLIEALVIMTIVVIFITASSNEYDRLMNQYSVDQAAEQILTTLKRARYSALADNRTIVVGFTANTLIFDKDVSGSCGACANETIDLKGYLGKLNVTISPQSDRVFGSDGFATAGTITVSSPGGIQERVIINAVGRAYQE